MKLLIARFYQAVNHNGKVLPSVNVHPGDKDNAKGSQAVDLSIVLEPGLGVRISGAGPLDTIVPFNNVASVAFMAEVKPAAKTAKA